MKIILILLIILYSNIFANSNKKITLQLNWLNQFQFAGYYIAKEKGFYDDIGIDLDIKEFTFDTDLLEEISLGNAQFAVGRSSLILDSIEGKDVVALGAIFQHSPLMLLVRENSNINNVKDLKNKKIMITSNAKMSASILAMLNSNGIGKNDYQTQSHSFNLDDLISGKTDAMASYLSNEPIRLKNKNIKYNILHPKDSGFDFYSDILFTSSTFISKNPKLTKEFYEATLKGWYYAFDNIVESSELIFNKYNTQNKSMVSLLKEAEALKKLAYNEDGQIGCLEHEKINDIVNVFKVLGITNKDIDLDKFIYEENNHQHFIVHLSHDESRILFLIAFLIFLMIALIVYFFAKNKEAKELLHTVINSTDDMIFYKDKNFKYIGCNDSFKKFVNKKESEILGKDDFDLFSKEEADIFRKQDMEILRKNELQVYEEWLEYGEYKGLFQTKKILFIDNKSSIKGILAISRDITKLYDVQKKLKEQSYLDELTKAFNRKSYNGRIEEKIESFRRYNNAFCVAMYDIDDFKNINDTYGHDVGDKVLIGITKEIQSAIRKTDFLFRIGGEEFIIIFPNSLLEEAFKVSEKIRIKTSMLKIIDKERITISLGISQIKREDTSESIYERIDKLMYKSKNNGKNQSFKS